MRKDPVTINSIYLGFLDEKFYSLLPDERTNAIERGFSFLKKVIYNWRTLTINDTTKPADKSFLFLNLIFFIVQEIVLSKSSKELTKVKNLVDIKKQLDQIIVGKETPNFESLLKAIEQQNEFLKNNPIYLSNIPIIEHFNHLLIAVMNNTDKDWQVYLGNFVPAFLKLFKNSKENLLPKTDILVNIKYLASKKHDLITANFLWEAQGFCVAGTTLLTSVIKKPPAESFETSNCKRFIPDVESSSFTSIQKSLPPKKELVEVENKQSKEEYDEDNNNLSVASKKPTQVYMETVEQQLIKIIEQKEPRKLTSDVDKFEKLLAKPDKLSFKNLFNKIAKDNPFKDIFIGLILNSVKKDIKKFGLTSNDIITLKNSDGYLNNKFKKVIDELETIHNQQKASQAQLIQILKSKERILTKDVAEFQQLLHSSDNLNFKELFDATSHDEQFKVVFRSLLLNAVKEDLEKFKLTTIERFELTAEDIATLKNSEIYPDPRFTKVIDEIGALFSRELEVSDTAMPGIHS